MSTVVAPVPTVVADGRVEGRLRGRNLRPSRIVLHTALIILALAWLVPIGTAVYSSFRYFAEDTQINGVFSAPETLTLEVDKRTAVAASRLRTVSISVSPFFTLD